MCIRDSRCAASGGSEASPIPQKQLSDEKQRIIDDLKDKINKRDDEIIELQDVLMISDTEIEKLQRQIKDNEGELKVKDKLMES